MHPVVRLNSQFKETPVQVTSYNSMHMIRPKVDFLKFILHSHQQIQFTYQLHSVQKGSRGP